MKYYTQITYFLWALFYTTNVIAIDEAMVEKPMRTEAGLYFTPAEANAYVTDNPDKILFIDVRDPAELHTVGMSATADANVPFMFIDTSTWDNNRQKFAMKANPEFNTGIERRLKEKSLNKNDTIILMCGSGVRSARAVNALHKMGYGNLYTVVTGFKGWQKDELEISKELDRHKMYGNPK